MTNFSKTRKLYVGMYEETKKTRFPSFAPRSILRSSFLKLNLFALAYLLLFSLITLYLFTLPKTDALKHTLGESTKSQRPNMTTLQISPTPEFEPTIEPTQEPESTPTPIPLTATPTPNTSIEDTTKTIENVANDQTMASANEIFNSLNSYRNEKGIASLSWDDTLANFANDRASTFASINSMDGHAGFRDFMNNNGFDIAGFNGLGENSAQLSGPMGGDKIIREIYGASESHNTSQLDPSWTHVGVAINGYKFREE